MSEANTRRMAAAVPYQAAYAKAAGDDLFGRFVRFLLDQAVTDGAADHPWADLDAELGRQIARLENARRDLLAVRRAERLPNGLTVQLSPSVLANEDRFVLLGSGTAGRMPVDGTAADWRWVVDVLRNRATVTDGFGRRCGVTDTRGVRGRAGEVRLFCPYHDYDDQEINDLLTFTADEADRLADHIEAVLDAVGKPQTGG